MSSQQKRYLLKGLFISMIAISVLLVVVGLAFISMYFWEGVISRFGEPDQSLLFWYLPILFIGIFSFMGGLALFFVSFKRFRQ
jgi:ABC-type Na+ efflux pump permease subunit